MITRRLLPAAVLLPLGVGWLRLQAQRAGWFGTEAGLSLFTLLNVIIFGVLIWANGAFLNRTERERTRAERATRRSQHLLQAVADNAAAIIWVKDLDGRYLLVNGSYENLIGLRREDIIGKTDYQLYPEEQAERYRAVDREALDGLTTVQAEEVAFHGDRPATYLSVKFPLFDETGKPYALCGISTDITERKLAEQTLAAERALLRTLIDALPDVVFAKDTAGRFTTTSTTSCLRLRAIPSSPSPTCQSIIRRRKASARSSKLALVRSTWCGGSSPSHASGSRTARLSSSIRWPRKPSNCCARLCRRGSGSTSMLQGNCQRWRRTLHRCTRFS